LKNIAIILAGGSGNRFGLNTPKQFVKLAGKTIIEHTIDAFEQCDLIDEIAIVVKPEYEDRIKEIILANKYEKVKKILQGGEERKDSSLSAIYAYNKEYGECNLLFHDAVRPFVSGKIIEDCIKGLKYYNAIDVAIPATDTIIEVKDSVIKNIPRRSSMMQGQTPQAFKLSVIKKAYDLALNDKNFNPTDDCSIVKKYLPNENIYVVQGSLQNIKVTYQQDLFIADKIIQLKTMSLQDTHTEDFYNNFFQNKVLIVFGGGYGIGYSIVKQAKEYGAKVYSFSRSETNTDVSSRSDVQQALERVYDMEGNIDFIVNTASVLIKEPLNSMSYDRVLEIININYIGAVNVIKESIKYLEKSNGQILNFTSSSYTRGRAFYSLYSSSKAAIVNLTQALAEELKATGIKINCINPERTQTPMRFKNFGYEDPKTLLDVKKVAFVSLNTLASNLTGQIVDVKVERLSI
jgi:2-C-methyl-D-erythritol 4-phosphate cytidylyltransferase